MFAPVVYVPPWESGEPGPKAATDNEPPLKPYNFDYVSENKKSARRLFVAEYIKDFNGTKAVMRLGWGYNDPAGTAFSWLQEPYTQFLLDQHVATCDAESLVTKNKVLGGLLREANSYSLDSSGASRVSAWGKLAKIKGMEITKVEIDKVAPGVMFVPLGSTPEEWEKNAAKQQQALQKQAKSA